MNGYGMADMEEAPASSETPMTEEGAPSETSETVTIPRELLGDRECKPGEKITLTVVSVDDEGVQATVESYGEEAPPAEGGYEEAGPAIDAMAS